MLSVSSYLLASCFVPFPRFNGHDPRAVMLAPLMLLASCTSSQQLTQHLANSAAPFSISDGKLEQWRNRCKPIIKRVCQGRIQNERDVDAVIQGYDIDDMFGNLHL